MGEKRLNKEQQAAVAVEQNAVVSAGAGSGKTTVLALRFLRLIQEGKAGSDEILTLTFTRKAAAEMYERIHDHLLSHRNDPGVADQLSRFDRAQISTLDSFCSQIVRGDCARYGVPGDFILDQDAAKQLAEQSSLDFLLRRKDEPAMARLLDLNGFNRTWNDFWAPLASRHISLVSPLEYQELAEKQLDTARERLEEMVSSVLDYRSTVGDLNPKAGKTIAQLQEIMDPMEDLPEKAVAGEWAFIEASFRKIMKVRKPGKVAKEEMVLAKEIITELKEILPQGIGYAVVLDNEGYLKGMAELMEEFQQDFLTAKRRTGGLTFNDVVELAVDILRTNPSLRSYYKGQFKYIMIDEFQDNNDLQRELLFLLAEKEERHEVGTPSVEDLDAGKLYFVGDEKQSIYRFRGAEVSVFKALKDEITKGGGVSLELDTNYRSEPGLIEFFNESFPKIMAGEGLPFEADFAPLKFRDSNLSIPARVELLLGLPMDDVEIDTCLSPKHREAFRVAEMIRQTVDEGTLRVFTGGAERAPDYGDFAVLLRSTGSQGIYERYFRLMDIPYDVQDVRSFYLEAPVNDLYSLLQTVAYPSDTLSYASLLRSPLVQLSDDSLTSLLLEGLSPFDSAGEAFMGDDQDLEAYRRGGELYHWCEANADILPLPELLEELWFSKGYRYILLRDPAYHSYLEYFDYLWALALEAETKGLSMGQFLDSLRPNLGTFERLNDVSVQKKPRPGVRIMTIHASKGLEFPITILGDCGASIMKGRDGAAPFYYSDDFGPTMKLQGRIGEDLTEWVNPFYGAAKAENQLQEEAELKRLLYVALTRAENHLILAGELKGKKIDSGGNLLNLFLRGFGITNVEEITLSPTLAPHLTLMEPVNKSAAVSRNTQGRRDLEAARVLYSNLPVREVSSGKREWSVTEWAEQVFQLKGELEFGEALPALSCDSLLEQFNWAAGFGTLCHLLIEERLKGWAVPGRQETLLLEIPEKERLVILSEAEKLVTGFFNTSLGNLSGAIRHDSEFSVAMKLPGEEVILRGQIDLLIHYEDYLLVVDFKTDSIRQPEIHREQLRLYCEAAAAIYGKSARGAVFYLRDGSIRELEGL